MGAYLSEPLREKTNEDGGTKDYKFGAATMQGWRIAQEDAHNCIPNLHDNWSLFAVYDGHGGSEVAQYTSEKFPDQIKKTLENFLSKAVENGVKNNDKNSVNDVLPKMLKDAFICFDDALRQAPAIDRMKEIRKNNDEDEEADEPPDENEKEGLYRDQEIPLAEILQQYGLKMKEIGKKRKKKIEKADVDEASNVASENNDETKVKHSDNKPELKRSRERLDEVEEAHPSPAKQHRRCNSEMPKVSDVELAKHKTATTITDSNPQLSRQRSSKSESIAIPSSAEEARKEQNDMVNKVFENVKHNPDSSPTTATAPQEDWCGATPIEDKQCSMKTDLSSHNNQENIEDEDESDGDYRPDEDDDDVEGEEESDDSDDDKDEEAIRSNLSSLNHKKLLQMMINGAMIDDSSNDEDEGESDDDDDDLVEEDQQALEQQSLLRPGQPSNIPGNDSGTTACVVLFSNTHFYVANAGDSRAVLCRNGKAVDLSVDHKPEDDEERKRIVRAGGFITEEGRVDGGLNLSRAFGDHTYKKNEKLPLEEQRITAKPDITVTEREKDNDQFMIVACDGIWNSMSSQEVIDFIIKRLNDNKAPSQIANELCDACLAPTTAGDGTGCDNMTVIIIKFDTKPLATLSNSNTVKEVKDAMKESPTLNGHAA